MQAVAGAGATGAPLSPSSSIPQPTLGPPARSAEVLNLLVRLIGLSLSLGLAPTALFLSERYLCLCPASEEALYLHALSLLRSSEPRQALEVLKSTLVESSAPGVIGQHGKRPACEASVRCAWVYAEAAIALGRPNDGSECLKRAFMIFGSGRNSRIGSADSAGFQSNNPTSNPAISVNMSLAKLAAQANKPDIAAQRYLDVLKAAWWCWEAYEGLCELGKAPEADMVFPAIPVPAVPDPPEEHPSSAAYNTDTTSLRPARSVSTDRAPLPSPALSEGTATPANGINGIKQHDFPRHASQSNGSSSNASGLGRGTSQKPIRTTSTPIEAQGAAFRFGEAGGADLTGTGVGLDMSMDNESLPGAPGNESSNFFAAAPARKGSFPGLSSHAGSGGTGSLFGFGRSSTEGGAGGPKKLFGTGLLFGNPLGAGSNATAMPIQPQRSTSGSSASGSFFTPINNRSDSAGPEASSSASIINGTSTNGLHENAAQAGRLPPAVKRNRNQVDIDDSIPAFQLNLRGVTATNGTGHGSVNGRSSLASSTAPSPQLAGEDSAMGYDQETHEHKVKLLAQQQDRVDHQDQSDVSAFFHPVHAASRPQFGRKGSAASASSTGMVAAGSTTRRSHRLNGISGQTPSSSHAAANLAPPAMARKNSHPVGGAAPVLGGKTRAVSNSSRERKRSKAGPSSIEVDEETAPSSADSATSLQAQQHMYHQVSSLHPPSLSGRFSSEHPASSSHLAPTLSSSSSTARMRHHPTNPSHSGAASSTSTTTYRLQLQAAQKALAENWLRGLFRSFGRATSALSRYECPAAVSSVLELPSEQQRCSRAVLILARAHFESLKYEEAEKAFSSARALAPHSYAGMEVYSTLLWHLHRPTELSYLAQELQALSPLLPHAWIATGNVFSHLEDHSNALKCFKRAIQTCPHFVYAHTLAGHECAVLEEWEPALGFFRAAVRQDRRHYNAWFGLGNVFLKTGKLRMAEYHFRKATEINPNNAMLVCCIGTVLEKLERKKEALEMYERACLLAPTSPAVRFKRVRMLMDLRQFDSALRDLMIVRELAPDEFNVHYLLGKLYGAMGDKASMTRSLTFAQDLEPRAAGRIREIIENSGRADSEEDDEGDDEDERERQANETEPEERMSD